MDPREDWGGGRSHDEALFEQIERSWGYDAPDEETCCDCGRSLDNVEDTARKIAVPLSWADCLLHPGDRHHLLPCEMYRRRA